MADALGGCPANVVCCVRNGGNFRTSQTRTVKSTGFTCGALGAIAQCREDRGGAFALSEYGRNALECNSTSHRLVGELLCANLPSGDVQAAV